jgi:TPR repeat protein
VQVGQRVITPTTLMEMDTGQRGLAWQIRGLFTFSFTDANGTERMINSQELRTLASQGIITPETPLETCGIKGYARQLPGLKLETPPSPPPPPRPRIAILLERAESGDIEAMFELVCEYNNTEGSNPEEILFWAEKAARLGHVQAQFELADVLIKREGTPIGDLKKGFYWLQQSAQNGYTKAKHNLAVCYLAGTGTSQDNEQAFYWMEQASNEGHPAATRKLGIFYIDGIGISVDEEKGIALLSKAVELGDKEAKKLLKSIHLMTPKLRNFGRK